MTTFARELTHGIVMSGLSVKEVAGKAGIAPQHLGALKRGDSRPPKASTVRDLCRVLKLNSLKMLALAHMEKRPRGLSLALYGRFVADELDGDRRPVKVGS